VARLSDAVGSRLEVTARSLAASGAFAARSIVSIRAHPSANVRGKVEAFMSTKYPWEKFYQASQCLCGPGSIQQRLAGAAQYLGRLRPTEHFPWPTLRSRFTSVLEALTRAGSYETSAAALSDHESVHLAEEIVAILIELTRLEEWSSPGRYAR
jgi:hypothetical protein